MAGNVVTFDFDDRRGEVGDAYDATLSLRKGASLRDGALRLDGRNDYAVVEGNAALAIDSGEVAFTFNADRVHGERTIMSRDSGGFDGGGHLTIWIDDGKLKVRLQSDSESFVVETDARAIQAHRDYDVAFRFGEGGMELEVDGVVVDTNAYTGGLAGNNEPLTLGASQMVSGDGKANHLRDYFDGEIKDFRITQPAEDETGAASQSGDQVVIAHEDFENGASGWSDNRTGPSKLDSGRFLGSFGGHEITKKTFDVPADVEKVTITFDFLEIDSWDHEGFFVYVDGHKVDLGDFTVNHDEGTRSGQSGDIAWTTVSQGAPSEFAGSNWHNQWSKDQLHEVTLEVPRSAISGDRLTLKFDSGTNQSRHDESFGIDNLKIVGHLPGGDDCVVTETLLHEDFNGLHDPEDSANVAGHTRWDVRNDALFTNGHEDGAITFKAVQLDGHVAGMFQFDIKANDVCRFEASGHAADKLQVQLRVDGGHWITIDTLRRDGHSDEFVGDQSGFRFGDDGFTTLSYVNDNFPAGAQAVEFRLVSHITAGDEVLRIDNVKITADKDECDKCPEDALKIDFDDLAAGTIVSGQYDHVTIGATAFGGGRTVHLEAEHMHRDGFHVAHGAQASGGDLVFASSSASANHPATLTSYFNGRSGTYDVTLFIQDESDGQSTLTVTIGGETRNIMLDRDTDGHGSNNSGFTPFVLEDLAMQHGDRIEISGFRNGGERVRIDKLKFEETTSSDNRAMIFDTDNITGGDGDLRAGDGKVLIISEDGDRNDPDDNARGGEITFDFDPGVTVDVASIVVVDSEEGGTVEAFDEAGQSLGVVDLPRIANNTTATVDLPFEGAAKVVVTLNGSGAIDDLCYKKVDAPLLGALGDKVFFDTDRDGVQDAGEAGVAGVTVTLDGAGADGVFGTADDISDTAETDVNGEYLFDDLEAGDYKVTFSGIPVGTAFTIANQGGDDAADSDADPANGMTAVVTLGAGETNLTLDAGVVELLASLGDRVFFDDNFNGQQDAGEAGVAGVTVTLTGGGADGVIGTADDSTATTITDADGLYSFDGLNPGEEYKVTFEADTLPEGFAFTDANVGDDASDSDADAVTGMTEIVTLAPGENNPTLDAGIVALASLGDRVFHDLDADGVQDLGEPGIPGALVKLLNGDGTPVLDDNGDPVETVTDADGLYSFDGLRPGAYKVMFVQPGGFSQISAANVGGDDAVDSDGDPADGLMTDVVTLAPGEDNTTLDQGLFNLAGLGDVVFRDLDKDGVQDTDEPGVDGVAVNLLDANGIVIDTTVTGDNPGTPDVVEQGYYEFRGLTPGAYSVMFVAPVGLDFTLTNVGDDALDSDADANGMTATVTLISGEFNPTIDAGLVNDAPVAGDAEAMLCVGLEGPVNGQGVVRAPTIVDLLDSVSDPDGDALTIENIFVDANGDGDFDDAGEFAGVGQTISTAEGLAATLNADGTVSLDGTNAAPDLLIRDTRADAFQYTVTDGLEAATGVVDVTLKGDLNTLGTIAESLPDTLVFSVTDTRVDGGFVDLTIDAAADDRLDGLVTNDAFCVDDQRTIVFDTPLEANVYLAVADSVPDGVIGNEENLDVINWILNEDFRSIDNGDGTGQTYNGNEIQAAIWNLSNGRAISVPPFIPGTTQNAQEIVDLALAQGEGFEAGEGDLVGLVLDPIADTLPPEGAQPFIVGIAFEDLSQDCFCG